MEDTPPKSSTLDELKSSGMDTVKSLFGTAKYLSQTLMIATKFVKEKVEDKLKRKEESPPPVE